MGDNKFGYATPTALARSADEWQKVRDSVERDYVDYLQHPDYGDGLPHCDDLVLHAPGECGFCDELPRRQGLRTLLKIAFTGQSDVTCACAPGYRKCPAEVCRPVEKIHRWGGNVPETPERKAERANSWIDNDDYLTVTSTLPVAKHAFNAAVDASLAEATGISNQRGGEYQDTWHVDNVVTLFQDRIDRLPKHPVPVFDGQVSAEWQRLRTIAALIDVKISRLLGPWKRDTGIDLINYIAAFTQWMEEYDQLLPKASR